MKKFLIVFSIVFGIAALSALTIFIYASGTYNNFVLSRNAVDTSWSQLEAQYQRRCDLIPNLVNATKGYLFHEKEVFADIAEARTRYAGAVDEDKIKAQSALDNALARLLVIIENYPDLKANATVKDLMFELAGAENRVNVARQRFNEETRAYNNSIQIFPNNFVASAFNFKEKQLYVSERGAEKAPAVNFEVEK